MGGQAARPLIAATRVVAACPEPRARSPRRGRWEAAGPPLPRPAPIAHAAAGDGAYHLPPGRTCLGPGLGRGPRRPGAPAAGRDQGTRGGRGGPG